jgi:hypothetical protein
MLTIERLRLQLPPGYRQRAASIGRLLTTELARMPLKRHLRLEHLSLPPVSIPPGAADGQIARHIAAAVQGQLKNIKRNRS